MRDWWNNVPKPDIGFVVIIIVVAVIVILLIRGN